MMNKLIAVIRVALLATLIMLFGSCDPVKRVTRLTEKYPYTVQYICTNDTLVLVDTVITDRITADTVVLTTPQDTIIIEKEKLRIQIIRRVDTLQVQGECLPDTVIVEREIIIDTPKQAPVKRKNALLWVMLGVGIMALLTLISNTLNQRK